MCTRTRSPTGEKKDREKEREQERERERERESERDRGSETLGAARVQRAFA